MPSSHRTELERMLRRSPATRAELQRALGVSQPTVSRLLSAHPDVLKIGRGRQTRYALTREVAGTTPPLPVFAIDEGGASKQIAVIHPIAPEGFWVASAGNKVPERIEPGLPFYLDDMRPAGFLGRLVPRVHTDLEVPDDVRLWTDDHVLQYLANEAWDAPGNLIVGDDAFQAFLRHAAKPGTSIRAAQRPRAYEEIAADVLHHGPAGSSAAGEQPKFLQVVERNGSHEHVLVKFSPPLAYDNPVAGRVSDLLVCEHVAHEVLRDLKIPASRSEVLRTDSRTFLEVTRFDRIGLMGRRGVVSLAALDAEFVGAGTRWPAIAAELEHQRIITAGDLERIRWLDVFGRLIANTDRHPGNISFFIDGVRVVSLAPAYDMAPAMYAPQSGELVERAYAPDPPRTSETSVWPSAADAALDFWNRVARDPHISDDLKEHANRNATHLHDLDTSVRPHLPGG